MNKETRGRRRAAPPMSKGLRQDLLRSQQGPRTGAGNPLLSSSFSVSKGPCITNSGDLNEVCTP